MCAFCISIHFSNNKVYFLHGTDQVMGVELNMTKWPDLSTKDEYTNFINQVVDGYVDLTKYKLTCETHWKGEDYYDIKDFHVP